MPVRPLDLYASDVDILVEMRPDGKASICILMSISSGLILSKDETVVTVGVMDLTLKNANASNAFETYLSLTAPRSLVSFISVRPLSSLTSLSPDCDPSMSASSSVHFPCYTGINSEGISHKNFLMGIHLQTLSRYWLDC